VALIVFAQLLAAMAEPSLLCVNCARPPPAHRRTWSRCTVCVERNLPSTYYCGQECMNAHWPKHKVYHKEQKRRAEQVREGTGQEVERKRVEADARYAERTGDEYDKRFADAAALTAEGDQYAAAKAYRKIIKEWPDRPDCYYNLAVVLQRSNHLAEAAPMCLKAMELFEERTEPWAKAASAAFDVFKHPVCREVPRPDWWDDEALMALSARVVAVAPGKTQACSMRAQVLSGDDRLPWNVGPRKAAEVKEAATWYRRAAKVTGVPADKLIYEGLASRCDKIADPLLAKEEVEAAKARAAAKAEEAEALKVAEAKAAAAAEELLAEEEKEKQHTSTKVGEAKRGKGKKGQGKR